MHTPLSQEWLERLKLAPRMGREFIVEAGQAKGHPYSETIRKALAAGVSGVFCLNGSPCAAVVLPPQHFAPDWLQELYTILWNQGELDFLFILFPDRVSIYTLDFDPRTLESSSTSLPSALLEVLEQVDEIEEVIAGLESGRLLKKKKGGLNLNARVDATLIRDLEGTRKEILAAEGIKKGDQAPKELVEQVHDVLLQAMFLLYLEDRGIIEPGYIHLHGCINVEKLFELLRFHTSDFFRLLNRLDRDLNGGLFKFNPLWEKHSGILSEFLHGMRSMGDGQGRLFRLYRFEHIPVELLSEVYDRFLDSEGEKKKQGAYYTPRRLAALVVEQIWDTLKRYVDAGRIPRVLDPSCGSGIFPALLFQRITGHLLNPSWSKLKEVAKNMCGIDTNPTAIQISAFSLYLALLHRAEPKELRKLMSKGKVLPELIGKTLVRDDFFNYPASTRYDCIIGNPPWGKEKQKAKSSGESWTKANKYPKSTRRERSWPFIWKSLTHLPPEGTLALLLPSTGFFLNNVKESMERLIGVARLERLVDLSDLRRALFRDAIFPTCILLATPTKGTSSYKFLYFCPKADLNATRGDRVLLAAGDRHLVDSNVFAKDSVSTTQSLMWFAPNERRLLSYLNTLPKLRDLPLLETDDARMIYSDGARPAWGTGLGFQTYRGKGKPIRLPELATLPYIAIKEHTPWVQHFSSSCRPYSETQPLAVRRNYPEGFTAPHIVTRLSIRGDSRLQANYAEKSYSFTKSLMGITVPDSAEDRAIGKFLTAMLNSAFVAWFMGTLGVGVDRPKFDISDLLSLPFPKPTDLPDPKHAEAIRSDVVAKMDTLALRAQSLQKASMASAVIFPSKQEIDELDNMIFAYFGLRNEEIVTIKESLALVRKAAQPPRQGTIPKLWEVSNQENWDCYCDTLGTVLSTYMIGPNYVYAEAIGYSKDIVIVRVHHGHGSILSTPMKKHRAILLRSLPNDLMQCVERTLGGNIYLQRCITLFTEKNIFLIKPRQRRFWLTSAAYMDAEQVLNDLLKATDVARDLA